MKKSVLHLIAIIVSAILLASCNEPPNPLLGKWRQATPPHASEAIIEFTPSTMRMNGNAVTVVYQFKENKVRVSASKHAIIYEVIDDDTVHYQDEKTGTVILERVTP